MEYKKRLYYDGHDWPDVLDYCQNEILPLMENTMSDWWNIWSEMLIRRFISQEIVLRGCWSFWHKMNPQCRHMMERCFHGFLRGNNH